uniref:Uncharacterized protein n=1 Tax=Solanum tuberosum TaxID=4113 RepID=M1DIM5_SOLTU
MRNFDELHLLSANHRLLRRRETMLPNSTDGDPVEKVPREETLPAPQEEVEENLKIEDEGDVEQEEDAPARNTGVPPLDPMLAQRIMYFLKGLVGLGVLPTVKTAQPSINLLVTATIPMADGALGTDAFFHPLLGPVMTGHLQAATDRP